MFVACALSSLVLNSCLTTPHRACSLAFPVQDWPHKVFASLGDLSSSGYKNLVLLQPDNSAYGYGRGLHRCGSLSSSLEAGHARATVTASVASLCSLSHGVSAVDRPSGSQLERRSLFLQAAQLALSDCRLLQIRKVCRVLANLFSRVHGVQGSMLLFCQAVVQAVP